MAIRFVTLDCAGTLIDVDWQPAIFAADCVERLGIPIDRPVAESAYSRLLQTRWRHYQQLNLTRDEEICDGFWRELNHDWMTQVGLDEKWEEEIWNEAWEGLYGANSRVFKLYDDSIEALEMLRERGLKLAALSNWDYSLHRVARMLGLEPLLDVVVASLEEGVEKPDPGIFEIALERLEAKPKECLHVGDNPLDDVQGAMRAGMKAVLLDRAGSTPPSRSVIYGLTQIPEVLDWIG